ncbi:MAG: ribosomal protein [Deltaproteobacteria bacterium]|jgi:large subunit ribosomal protein L35|nr:ribosomal protein [Deltaproteobacteria bacterium]
MPKIKTCRGAAKRFKTTGSGRIKRGKAFRRHILSHKGRKRKRQLRSHGLVAAADHENIRKLIPYL